jgi:hypothetical protein
MPSARTTPFKTKRLKMTHQMTKRLTGGAIALFPADKSSIPYNVIIEKFRVSNPTMRHHTAYLVSFLWQR